MSKPSSSLKLAKEISIRELSLEDRQKVESTAEKLAEIHLKRIIGSVSQIEKDEIEGYLVLEAYALRIASETLSDVVKDLRKKPRVLE